MPNRLDFLDCAKGISITLVVIFHATMALQKHDLADGHYWLLNNFMSPIRMPVFFFISGFLLRRTAKDPNHDAFLRKVVNVAYLFALWSILHLAWRTLSPLAQAPAPERWILFLVSPSSVLWFIWALAIYFCVARAGRVLPRKAIFGAALILSLSTYLGVFSFDNYAHANVLTYLPFFLFGAWYSEPLVNSRLLRHPLAFPLSLTVFAVGFVLLYKGSFPMVLESASGFLLAILGVVVGLSTAIFLCGFGMICAVPVFLGRNTLGIYVAHSPIVATLAAGAAAAGPQAMVMQLGVPLVAVAAILLSLGLKLLLEKAGFRWLYKFPFALTPGPAKTLP